MSISPANSEVLSFNSKEHKSQNVESRYAKLSQETNRINTRNRAIVITLCVIAILALLAYAGYGFYIK